MKKKSVKARVACAVGKVLHKHTVDDSVQYIGSLGKKHVGRKKTQTVAGVNSLNSSRWNPRILCNTTKGARAIKEDDRTVGGSVWQVP